MWPEVECIFKESRYELVLSGNEISKRLVEGIDKNLFNLTSLNLLKISDTTLDCVPDEISKLLNLQLLVLNSNKIVTVTIKICELTKLKLLDLSNNHLKSIPESICELSQLTSLNLSSNKLETFPSVCKNTKLIVLNLSHNKLSTFPSICHTGLNHLSEVNLRSNSIPEIPVDIKVLKALKILDLSYNQINVVPGEISDCNKLKEVNFQNNPIKDKRFLKLIDQCRTKQVLAYVRQHCLREGGLAPVGGTKRSGRKQKPEQKNREIEEVKVQKDCPIISVRRTTEEDKIPNIQITEEVKNVRPYIVGCIIKNLCFDEKSLKMFLRMQTKLHETICEKRSAATVATHDLSKFLKHAEYNLTYTALPPDQLIIHPINRGPTACTGAQLFQQLRNEAEILRREKKRNTFTGIFRYLHLLEGHTLFPCLCDASGTVISFPPIINSCNTQIDLTTQDIFVEVTSAKSVYICRRVLDELLKETALLRLNNDGCLKLVVLKVKTVDMEGNLKTVYPSKTDLIYNNDEITIIRE